MFEKFEHTFDIKSIDKEKRIIRGVASLEEVDRDREIIALDAIDKSLEGYKQNPIIRFMHKEPIGRAIPEQTFVDRMDKAFIVTAYITDKTQIAKEAWALIDEGIIKSFSVGGKVLEKEAVKEGGREVTKITNMELYEVSVVDIPSNRKSFFEIISKSIEKQSKDDIAQELFNKPYSELTDEEKAKVNEKLGGKSVIEDIQKPFAGYENFAACMADQQEKGKAKEDAEKICGKLQAEGEGKGINQDINKPGEGTHSDKWHRCVEHVRESGSAESPEAVCTAELGEESFNRSVKELTSDEIKNIDDFVKKLNSYLSEVKVGKMTSTIDDSKNKKEEEQCQKLNNLKKRLLTQLKQN
jgi:HK97 family phage prohead protease